MSHIRSLGDECAVATNLNTYRPRVATGFFDTIISSFEAVLKVIETPDIRRALQNIEKDMEYEKLRPIHSKMLFKDFDDAFSVHDMGVEGTPGQYKDFVDKYTRRYHRLMKDIYDPSILFVRYFDDEHDEHTFRRPPTPSQLDRFFDNSLCRLLLVGKGVIEYTHPRLYVEQFADYPMLPETIPWSQYDWKSVLDKY